MSRVYVSVPLTGPNRAAGRELLRGAELARRSVDLVALDAFGENRDALAAEHAQRAADDPEALAVIGGFHSSQAMSAAPALENLLFVTPSATYSGLRGATLVRLMPDDTALARAVAQWLEGQGVERLLLVHDHDEGYGVPVGRMCAEAVRADVRSRPVWDWDEDMAADIADAEAVLYVGVAGSGAVRLWEGLHALDERLLAAGHGRCGRPAAGPGARRRSGRADPLLQHPSRAVGVLRLRGDGARAGRDRVRRRSRGNGARGAVDARPRLRARPLLDRRARPHDQCLVRRARGGRRRDRVGAHVTSERGSAAVGRDRTTRERFRGALLGLAVGDAVGTTVEFTPPGTFAPVRDMVGGGPFSLPAGAWTDDTSMALCLAESLVERRGVRSRRPARALRPLVPRGPLVEHRPLLRHRQRDARGAGALRAHGRAVSRATPRPTPPATGR